MVRAPRFVGVVHLPALPGDPRHPGGPFAEVLAFALRDAEALATGGVDAIVVENFGSAPFAKGTAGHRLPPHQAAGIAIVAHEVRARFGVPVGVNCLRNDALSALGIAAITGAAFVRVNVHAGAYVTDQGLIEGEADQSLRYRRSLGADAVAIYADVLVKHAAPLVPIAVGDAAKDTLLRGLADGIVITGAATGAPIDRAVLEEARKAANDAPILLGSGVTPATAPALCPLADGAIVGTWLKERGELSAPVDAARVRELAAVVRATLRPA